MPWHKTDSQKERAAFCRAALERRTSMAELCDLFEVSTKTAYKWLARWKEGGDDALADQSRRPHGNSTAVDDKTAARLVAVRMKHPSWGARKLLAWLGDHGPEQEWPAASTVTDLLKRRGLVTARRRRQRSPLPRTRPLAHATQPNALWAMDFKGDFRLGDGRRCYPLTVNDQFSRMALCCRALPSTACDPVQQALTATFRSWGLPDSIRSDNGAPFGAQRKGPLSRLGVWLVKVGVMPEYTDLASPEQNARQERFHGTLKPEATIPPAPTMRSQQRRFDEFVSIYNNERPHEALDMRTPSTIHKRSPRELPARVRSPEYPASYEVRRVSGKGYVTFKSVHLYLGEPFAGEPVGIAPVDELRWEIWFGSLIVGYIHEAYPDLGLRRRTLRIEPRIV